MRRGRGALGGRVTRRGGHGLVNDGESAQAQALFVEDLHDGGDVRAAHADVGGDQVGEGLEARARAQVVVLGDLAVVVGQRLRVRLDARVRVLRGRDRQGHARILAGILVWVADEQADNREGQFRQLQRLHD